MQTQPTELPYEMTLGPGQIIGRYQIEKPLDAGGMGSVFLVRHRELGHELALKIVNEAYLEHNDSAFERFLREAKLMAKLRCRNIVSLVDYNRDPQLGIAYLVMEYVDAGNLRQLLEKHGPLDEFTSLCIIYEVANGLKTAHDQNIVHRDIKPANILFTSQGEVKLTDFGIAKELEKQNGMTMTLPTATFGTYTYMSPEQLEETKNVRPCSDIFSLGITLYQILTGHFPYEGTSTARVVANILTSEPPDPRIFVPELSDWTHGLLKRMLLKNVDERIASGGALMKELEKHFSNFKPFKLSEIILDALHGKKARAFSMSPGISKSPEAVQPISMSKATHVNAPERNAEANGGDTKINSGNTPAAIRHYQKSAEQGDAEAQFNLGLCYENGDGVDKNVSEAVKWYHKAAEQGNADAQYHLGSCFYYGDGIAKDASEAVKWYRKAAERNVLDAQYMLGNCFYYGQGIAQDAPEAVKWFRKAAEQEHLDAQYMLGCCYYYGYGIAQDATEAVKWFRVAANLENAYAQYMLGSCFYYGYGTSQDSSKAVKWFLMAANHENSNAQYMLGNCYYYGNGIGKDISEAMKWFRKAAEQGNAHAQNHLGWCYGKGEGIGKDAFVAVKWYRKAAEQGNAMAQYNLGWCYGNGEGVVKDACEAAKWYRKAAEQENASAQYMLGKCYNNGIGVVKDVSEATKWLKKASERGHVDARKLLEVPVTVTEVDTPTRTRKSSGGCLQKLWFAFLILLIIILLCLVF